jgi:2-polyprenyl-3-methyl-5-hydroxy-6-metoxy-1,4-benzoquinol methylase
MLVWNRLRYVLSPQFDVYENVSKKVTGVVADIGFGTGFGSHLLTINAKFVQGYETDDQAISFAKRVFPFPNVSFGFGDIEKGIPHIDKFDFVLMIDVIEHIPDDKKAIKNVKEILTMSGSLILSTPNKHSRYKKSEDHQREYSVEELETLLRTSFQEVNLLNYKLEPLVSQWENPIIAICKGKRA